MVCVQYYIVVGKTRPICNFVLSLTHSTHSLQSFKFYFLDYQVEIGERRRMAAGKKSDKEKGLKMRANVKSVLSIFLSFTGTFCHIKSDSDSVVLNLKSTV